MTSSLSDYQIRQWREFFQAMGWAPEDTGRMGAMLADMFSQGAFRPINPQTEPLIFGVFLRDWLPYPNSMRIRATHMVLRNTETRECHQGLLAATSRRLIAVDDAMGWNLLLPYANVSSYRKSLEGTTGHLSLVAINPGVDDARIYLWLSDGFMLQPFLCSRIELDITLKLPSEPGWLNAAFIALLASSGLFGLIWAGEEYQKALERVGVASAIMHRLGQFCEEIIGGTHYTAFAL